ncbi:DNA-dependent RNA polymerase subunit epsilon [Sutcliffiella cohnii]
MIFKVYYQEQLTEAPVREKTKTVFVEGEAEKDVRIALKDKPYNIEIVIPVEGEYLAYEQQSEHFKVLEIR